LGYVTRFKQKRRECKHYHQQIHDALRLAWTHFRNCTTVTSAQKRSYFGNSYEKEEEEENILMNSSSINASSTSASFLRNISNISTSMILTISMPILLSTSSNI
jgi:hypothetical protein